MDDRIYNPGPPLRARTSSLPRTSTAVSSSSTVEHLGRPSRVRGRSKLPAVSRARSGAGAPSVAVNSQTENKSMSVAVGAKGKPPSTDQSKLLPPHIPIVSARGGKNRVARRCSPVWCCPGKGTPSNARNAVFPPLVVARMTDGIDASVGPVVRRKRKFKRVTEFDPLESIAEEPYEVPEDRAADPHVDASTMTSCSSTVPAVAVHGTEGSSSCGDFPSSTGTHDSICALDPPAGKLSDDPRAAVFPPKQVRVARGERADYLSEFTRAVGGDVSLDRRHHTAYVQQFAGAKAVRTHACTALLDTGSPASFIQEKVWNRMLACGAASVDGVTEIKPKKWGGFHGVPLITSRRVRLNVHMWKGGTRAPGVVRSPTVCLAVYAHIVPDAAMSHAVLLGRDSWSHFPVRTYRDVSASETIVTFVGDDDGPKGGDARYEQWVSSAVGMVESAGGESVVARYAGTHRWLPNAISWVTVQLTTPAGTAVTEGTYYVRFREGWYPQEAIVEAGVTEIPMQRLNDDVFFVQSGMRLGEGGAPLRPFDLCDAEIASDDTCPVSAVSDNGDSANVTSTPPPEVIAGLDPSQREAFLRLWARVPPHLHAAQFDFEAKLWAPADIDALGELLCKYEHRFSRHATDLGHVTVDPFRIILKKDAQPVKQRPYRHSPVLAAKVQTEIDKLVLAGILRRSYSNWSSPLVVIAKADGRIRLTCNYKRVNAQSVIPVMPLPTVDDLLSDLGGASVFSTMDLVSGFFQCSIHEDSVPLTAVCTQSGNYEWTVMPMGLASSPGWFQSIMLRVCEGLNRVRLFIDDIVCFSKNGEEHVQDLANLFERLTTVDLKLAPNKAHLGFAPELP